MDFHANDIKAVFKELKSSAKGISQPEAEKGLVRNGPNEMPKGKPLTKTVIFFAQFKSPLVIILLLAGAFSLAVAKLIDAGVIFGAVAINVIIGFFQENKANQAIQKLKSLVDQKSVVMRGGQELVIEAKAVVPGDVLILKAGNRIPADARLFESVELQVNEASLTGESLPSRKSIETVPKGAALADRGNMVYAGTMAVHGLGKAVVTATGAATEIGRIATLVNEEKEEATPLQIRLAGFSRFLGIMFLVICVLIVLLGLLQRRELFEMVETGVALGVASIPEGLTVAVTFILALGMQRILKQKALTRKLVATETLGSTTVICTDKTGTLTEGKMHVAHIVIGENEFEFGTLGSRQDSREALAVSLALQTAMMCNDAVVENPKDELKSWRIIGSPTEAALLSAAIQSGLRKEELLKKEPLVDELPFDSERKYMISLHRDAKKDYILYEKGAPEKLFPKCVKYHHQGRVKKLDEAAKQKLTRTYENLTAKGLRVIGLAVRNFHSQAEIAKGQVDWAEIDSHLDFIGFIAIKDPLRPEAADTIKTCQAAGIRPILITGDHRLTAKAIAAEVGLKADEENILEGHDLEATSDDDLNKLIKKIDIFARVSPHHKLRIVKALQDNGEVVAMTGDGINDSPALKAADIGISLGTGTDIAKETSDIVLLDDNFSTIVAAVRQGRIIFQNIRKVIVFLVSDSFSSMMLVVGSILLGSPLAILPLQILWINIVNDTFPHFALAFEKGGDKEMRRPPLKKDTPLLNREMKRLIFGVGLVRDVFIFGLFFLYWQHQVDMAYLRSLFFALLGTKSLIGIFALRDFYTPVWRMNPFENKFLLLAVAFSFSLMLLAIYAPFMQAILDVRALGWGDWSFIATVSLFAVLLTELVKYFNRLSAGTETI